MATFTHHQHEIYYEIHGSGAPLVLLNGIFMSCASWQAFIPSFSQNNQLILLDLLGQGKSSLLEEEYTQLAQVEAVRALLNHLGIEQTNLLGISYGGEVAMQFAALYPERVSKLVLSNTTAYTSPWLRDIGHSWEFAFASEDGHQFFKTCIPIVYSPQFYEENYDWLSAREEMFVKAFTPAIYAAFGRLTRSAQQHDARPLLSRISAQTLVISAQYDYVTPPYQQQQLTDSIQRAGHVQIQGAGHAVMYEKPAEFAALVLGFVNQNTNIRTVP